MSTDAALIPSLTMADMEILREKREDFRAASRAERGKIWRAAAKRIIALHEGLNRECRNGLSSVCSSLLLRVMG